MKIYFYLCLQVTQADLGALVVRLVQVNQVIHLFQAIRHHLVVQVDLSARVVQPDQVVQEDISDMVVSAEVLVKEHHLFQEAQDFQVVLVLQGDHHVLEVREDLGVRLDKCSLKYKFFKKN